MDTMRRTRDMIWVPWLLHARQRGLASSRRGRVPRFTTAGLDLLGFLPFLNISFMTSE